MDVQEGVGVGLLGAVATKAIEAIAKAFGSRKERAEADVLEAAPAERAAELALRIAEQERDETEKVRRRLDALTDHLLEVERDMRTCDARSLALDAELAWMRRAIESIYRGDTEPPPPSVA